MEEKKRREEAVQGGGEVLCPAEDYFARGPGDFLRAEDHRQGLRRRNAFEEPPASG